MELRPYFPYLVGLPRTTDSESFAQLGRTALEGSSGRGQVHLLRSQALRRIFLEERRANSFTIRESSSRRMIRQVSNDSEG